MQHANEAQPARARHAESRWTAAGARSAPARRARGLAAVAMTMAVAMAVTLAGVTLPKASAAAPSNPATVYVVTSAGDGIDAAPGNGTCAAGDGTCTLRAALEEARLDHGPSLVRFAIPGSVPQRIQLGAQLPAIDDDDTTVDGYTQPGATPNTNAGGSNAVIGVEIRGNGPRAFSAFYVTSDRNTIRGLAIFSAAAKVKLREDANDNRIVGNFLGTDATGTFTETEFNPNGMGVSVNDASDRNRIGTPDLADRNVVAGNSGRGISFFFDSSDNIVQNNVVGLSPAGAPRGNFGHGIDINFGSSHNLVGGTGTNERNVVAANHAHGIEISHELTTVGNRVVGNLVGTRLDGRGGSPGTGNWNFGIHLEDHSNTSLVEHNTVAYNRRGGITLQRSTTRNIVRENTVGMNLAGELVGNGDLGWGIRLADGSTDNTIGPGNVVRGNFRGIEMAHITTLRNRVTRNSVSQNRALGLDYPPFATANPNDAGDADTGTQTLLNWPVLTAEAPDRVTAQTCAGCTVELFVADGSAGEFGEGATFLVSTVADAGGSAVLAPSTGQAARVVTAVAIDRAGNTSEFSRNVMLPGAAGVPR